MALPVWGDERPSSGGQSRKKVVRHIAWLFLGLSGLIIVATFAELPDSGFFSSVQTFWQERKPSGPSTGGMSERDLLVMDYVSSQDPPTGFEQWLRFARQNQCHMGPYRRIERDLEAFREGAGRGGISREKVEAAKKMPRVVVFTVKNKRLSFSSEGTANFSSRFALLMQRFTKFLPDMEFVVNDLDEPRILPGSGDDVNARLSSKQCENASEDFRLYRHLHGSVNSRPSGAIYKPSKELLPIFSQSKINECYADITYPTLYNVDNLLTPQQEKELRPWRGRNETLFFRGATSGGHYTVGVDFTLSHRQRLVQLAKTKPHMDIAFTDFLQCDLNVCKKMQAYYGMPSIVYTYRRCAGQGARVEQKDNFKYKYLMSIDGNTFVSRLPLFMSSGSLPFRAGLYSEWFDEWVRENEHYLRVKLDYSNLEAQLAWALANDGQAKMIGQTARDFAKKRLRNQDMECYLYRLLLEYAALLQP